MEEKQENQRTLVVGFMKLRKIIGFLGVALPFLLFLGALVVFGTNLQRSISSYYHTGMRDVFVGTLCIIGFFMLSYKGYKGSWDNIIGNLACIFAVGLAIFPTAPDRAASSGAVIIGYIHLAFAALFFAMLIIFSLLLFTKTKEGRPRSTEKRHRDIVYRLCGYAMASCIVLIAVYYISPDEIASRFETIAPVFWLETAAIIAFGVSWLTKGQAILGDPKER